MRHLILAIACSLSLAACKPTTPPAAEPAQAATPAAPAAIEVVNGYLAAWNAHDIAKAGSYFAEQGVYLDASVGTPQQGRQAATDNVIKVFLTAVPDAKWTMKGAPVVSADSVAFEWNFSGTNTGDWSAETKATGKPLDLNGVSIFRIEQGKIVYQGDYYDAATFNKEMGW